MKEKNRDKRTRKSSQNREFAVVAYSFLAIFVLLMGYLIYFQAALSEQFINNPYNKRQELFEQQVVRGSISTADGVVVAETLTGADGAEVRHYPYDNMFAHVVGYSNHGKTGIEALENFHLLRSNVSAAEKVIEDLQAVKNRGDNVVTTLSFDLQKAAYEAIGVYRGAVVVMEPATGKILAMVSKPDYNPNTIVEDWSLLTAEDNDKSQLLNRATQGLYPPGSTFKILTTLEYLAEHPDYQNYQYHCSGVLTVDNNVIHCYANTRHGQEDLMSSFAHSCNTSYASLGLDLDIGRFGELCGSMLFNSSLPLPLEYKQSSFVLKEGDSAADIMETSIGQGKTLVTPFHMALITCAIANDGMLMKPYVIDHIENANQGLVEQYRSAEYRQLLKTEDAAVMQEFLKNVVQEGTGREFKDASYEVAGKTGSAEYHTGSDSSHSWFVGYAHMDGKEDIAVAVLAERAGSGSEYALPIAKEIFDSYYKE